MKKKNKSFSIFLLYFFLILFYGPFSLAEENFSFLTLKNNKVNLRQGPSFDYPIKLIYNKKYLPVIILEKYDTWRKIKDFQNNSGWIHISQLSKKNLQSILKTILYYIKNLLFILSLLRMLKLVGCS